MSREHGGTKVESAPALEEPSLAERARTLVALHQQGTLSSVSRKHPGFPFGSLMPYALDGVGWPVFLISTMAMHTQNLNKDARASLFVAEDSGKQDPLGAARVTVVGRAEPTSATESAGVRELYLAAHPGSNYWVDFSDFAFYRLEPAEIYYVGGFGVMGWVAAAAYAEAEPDPLASAASGILAHMNVDHQEAMLLLARVHAGLEASSASMTAVDRLGFRLHLETAEGARAARVNFLRPVRSAGETRSVLIEMVRAAGG